MCSSDAIEWAHYDDVHLMKCIHCGHCFTDETRLESVENYESDYYDQQHKNWFSNPQIELFEQIAKFVERKKPNAKVIDIGCGKGALLRYLRTRLPKVELTGIDLSYNAPLDGIEFIQADSMNYTFEHTYDVIINLAVIEHIYDVRKFSFMMYHLCNENGWCIINTVNQHSLLYQFANWFNLLGFDLPLKSCYQRHHLNHFSNISLRLLLESTGFETVRTHFHNSSIKSVDFPNLNLVYLLIIRTGVWGLFILGKITKRTYMQTVFVQKSKGTIQRSIIKSS